MRQLDRWSLAEDPRTVEVSLVVERRVDERDERLGCDRVHELDPRRIELVGPVDRQCRRRAARTVLDEQRRIAVEQRFAVAIDREQQPHAAAGAASERDAGKLEGCMHEGIVPRPIGFAAVISSSTRIALVAAAALALGGCGDPKQVTYVDPNGADVSVVDGEGGEPFRRYGAAALERSRACIGVRAALSVARTIAVTDVADAGEPLEAAIDSQLPIFEPRAAASVPGIVEQLRTRLEELRDVPPTAVDEYSLEVRGIDEQLLKPACDAAVPITARQDASFRAAMLQETLQDAATAYEESFDGTDEVQDLDAYHRAYGLLIDASTRQLEAVPQPARPRIRASLDRITRSATPGPTPPSTPRNAEVVTGDLAALADDVTLAARIDPTLPDPDPRATDQLRTLKREIAAAVEAAERGEREVALEQLRTADRNALQPAASSIATVSPTLLAELERDVLMTIPDAVRAGGDVVAAASDFDERLDEAIQLLEDELELLRGQ